jgi:hypothetical protein
VTPPKRSDPKQEKGKKFSPSSENQKISPEQQKPIFSLYYLQKSHCLSDCDREQKSAFADTLHKLSQLTWNQIISSPRHGAGCERIAQDAIRVPIPSHLQSDVNLLAFRFCAKAPMVGYREGNIFHVVWLDRAFTLYDHG